MSKPGVHFTVPSWDLFKFPPDPLPPSLPPPVGEHTFRSPFGIQPWLYNLVMHPIVPFTFAITYVLVILRINAYNNSRGNKPWWIARQKLFKYFTVVHNVGLAIYSFTTFIAMFRAISHTLPELGDATGTAGIADALCKMHGPRVLGDAVTFNTTISIWESKNQLIRLNGMGNPDPTDAGRLWNEGLAFWGWLFYLSKFYEVLDTFIIVAKGKRSPTLQTYHHSGAMLSMWAGIRYMSPPIWMFVFVNSFIHSLMYVYYTLSALDIRVRESSKRTLTSLQITQILFGASYATLHLFISYDIPVATPYKVLSRVAAVASSASSAISSASSSVSSVIESPTVSSSLGLLIKKLLLRAAGEEGAAERLAFPAVTDKPIAERIESKLDEVRERVFHQPSYETKWRTDYTRVNCIDTSGEAFAIWLNLLYLAPLAILFARFFIKAYITRSDKSRNVSQAAKKIRDDAKQAEADTESTLERAGKRAEDLVKNGGDELKKEIKSLYHELREDVRKLKKGDYNSSKLNERVEKFNDQVKESTDKAKQKLQSGTESVKDSAGKAKQKLESSTESVKESADKAKQKLESSTESVKKESHDATSDDETEGEDKENQSPSTSGQSSQTPDKKKKKKNKNKNKHGSSSAAAAHDNVPAQDESASKQDSNLAASQPTRPGTGTAATSGNVPAQSESASKQDSNLAASEPTRPGTTDAIDNDTDAMGKSGVGVDLSKSVAGSSSSN